MNSVERVKTTKNSRPTVHFWQGGRRGESMEIETIRQLLEQQPFQMTQHAELRRRQRGISILTSSKRSGTAPSLRTTPMTTRTRPA